MLVFSGAKGQTSVIVKSDPSISVDVTAAGSKVDLTMVHVDLNKRHVRDLAPVSRENKRCRSQQTCITIVEPVHRRPLAYLV